MTSKWKSELLVEQFKLARDLLHWCPLMVDLPNNRRHRSKIARISCIGNFRHAPNWDAVLWLKTVIWPMIREQIPDAQLHIMVLTRRPRRPRCTMPPRAFT
jgi:hypothetical protein